jgi:hypothetical protein
MAACCGVDPECAVEPDMGTDPERTNDGSGCLMARPRSYQGSIR